MVAPILGIDPSINKLWLALLAEDWTIKAMTYETRTLWNNRYYEIFDIIVALCLKHHIQTIGIETQYIAMNRSATVLMVAEVKAACRMALYVASKSRDVYEIYPKEAKAVFGISWKRDYVKKAIVEAVLSEYPYLWDIDDNAADAVSIALSTKHKIHGIWQTVDKIISVRDRKQKAKRWVVRQKSATWNSIRVRNTLQKSIRWRTKPS